MRSFRHSCAALTAACSAITLGLAVAVPAQAVTTGWRVVFTHHYGKATNYSAYSAVAAPGPGDAWAFGTTDAGGAPAPGVPVAEHWNGTAWSSSALPSGLHSSIDEADAVSASSVWAVTEVNGDILHWTGSQWSLAEQEPGTSGLLATGITAVSDSDVWAFGCAGLGPGTGTWHYNGQTWAQVTGSAVGVVSASALSATNIWGIGSNSRGPCGSKLVHYNGTTWQTVTGLPQTGLEFGTTLALSSTDVWVTAGNTSGGDAQLLHYDGSTWTSIKVPYSGLQLYSFVPDGHGGFWMNTPVPQGETTVLHYSATGQWSRTVVTSGGMNALALVPGTGTLWGVGAVTTAPSGSNARIWAYGQAG